MKSRDQDCAKRIEGRQMLGAVRSLLFDFFFCFHKSRAAVGSTGRLLVWPRSTVIFTWIWIWKKNQTKPNHCSKTQQISLAPESPFLARLLHSCSRQNPPYHHSSHRSSFFGVSPTRPSNSPFLKISSCLWICAISCRGDLLTAKPLHLLCSCSAKSGSYPCVLMVLSTEPWYKAGSPKPSADPELSGELVTAQPAVTAISVL